eukprot:TRINITY_DN30483_c0_g5_i1.p1 TRINITY_DN30483_c0_g5~~TRINITY_DN30483_c0_g5_i1.p1  ORF type:complete len:484 (+),score=60.11 TRINITY_DN30483_c0_g5_i1:201-1652(+)
MQPLLYLALRILLGWTQFIERSNRAFLATPLVLISAGAMHSWAVVYAMFLAVYSRAMRSHGYADGFEDQLPRSIALTEAVAVASLWIWLLSGVSTAVVRILDEDVDGLPVGMEDTRVGPILRCCRSQLLRSILGHAQSISVSGLFTSILLLCVTMAFMDGGNTACELCLILISVVFAVPHAVLAVRQLDAETHKVFEGVLPTRRVEAAAAEASALGPQLCIVLALADSPGHAYFWQNLVYALTAIAFLLAVAACFRHPPKLSDMALPPEVLETLACAAVDAITAVAIVLSYSHLQTWFLCICALGLACVVASLGLFREVREFYIEWLEPIFVVRNDTHRRLPCPARQLCRKVAYVTGILCVLTALWDILMHPSMPASARQEPPATSHEGRELMMLRWRASATDLAREPVQLLRAATSDLSWDIGKLRVEQILEEHRLMIFDASAEPSTQMLPEPDANEDDAATIARHAACSWWRNERPLSQLA